MRRVVTFLTEDVPWSRVLGIALGAAFLSFLVPETMRTLILVGAFPVGAILVAQAGTKHPYRNALLYGISGVIFVEMLYFLVILGEMKRAMTWEEVQATAYVAVWIIPQSLAGAWVSTSFRRAREVGEQRAQAEAAKKRAAGQGDQVEAGGRKTEAGGRKPEAGSRRSEAGSRKPEAGSRGSEAGSRKPEAGSRGTEAGGRKSKAGGRKK